MELVPATRCQNLLLTRRALRGAVGILVVRKLPGFVLIPWVPGGVHTPRARAAERRLPAQRVAMATVRPPMAAAAVNMAAAARTLTAPTNHLTSMQSSLVGFDPESDNSRRCWEPWRHNGKRCNRVGRYWHMKRFLKSPSNVASLALAGLLVGTGVTHFVLPGFYDAIVPRLLPGPRRAWTLASGVAELACAAAVAKPRTRRVGAFVAAVLFIAVFPANLQMAWDWRHRSGMDKAIAYGRLPLQVPLVLWALAVRARSRPRVLSPDRP